MSTLLSKSYRISPFDIYLSLMHCICIKIKLRFKDAVPNVIGILKK